MYSPPQQVATVWRGCAGGKAKVANPPLGPALVVVVAAAAVVVVVVVVVV